jgi:hypothetical protein
MTRSTVALAVILGCLPAAAACSDLESYRGEWSGAVVGGSTPVFILRGFPEGTVLTLEDLSPPPTEGPPGFLTTSPYVAFDRTPLEVIVPLEHDQLSLYEFPGGRVRNYIFAARPTAGPIAGRDATVFVSLMEDERVEVRVLVGSGDETNGGHFGLWRLVRP